MIPYISVVDKHLFGLPVFWNLVILGVLAGFWWACICAKQRGIGSAESAVFLGWIALASLLGSHVFAVLFYAPQALHEGAGVFLRFREGISSFGGFISAALALWLYLLIRKQGADWLLLVDLVVQGFVVGWLFGRLGCSLVHDHPGELSSFFLAIQYPGGVRHDLGWYEFLLTLLVLLPVSLWIYRRNFRPATQFGAVALLYGVSRFFLDMLRIGEERYFGLTLAQYLSFFLALSGGLALVDLYTRFHPLRLAGSCFEWLHACLKALKFFQVLAAAATAGMLYVLSPPFGLGGLAWIAFVPLLLAMHGRAWREKVALALIAGLGAAFLWFSWLPLAVSDYSNIPYFISLAAFVFFAAWIALPFCVVFSLSLGLRQHIGVCWIAAAGSLQVLFEWLWPAVFPFQLGLSQHRVLPVWQLASVLGASGVSFLIVVSNCWLSESILRLCEKRRQAWPAWAVIVLMFSGALCFGGQRYSAVEAEVENYPVIRVSQIQSDLPLSDILRQEPAQRAAYWLKLSIPLKGEAPQLYIWPEGSFELDLQSQAGQVIIRTIARVLGEPLLFGSSHLTAEGDLFNSVYLLGPDGNLQAKYDKMVLVPFSESFSWLKNVPFLRDLIKGPRNFKAGQSFNNFEILGFLAAVPICYEAIFERFFRTYLADVDLVINLTFDAWFGRSAAPYQHAMLAAARAMEYGRTIYRLGYTGQSMVVLPSGRVLYETQPFEKVVRVIEVPLGGRSTWYASYGQWWRAANLAWITCLALIIIRRRSRAVPVKSAEGFKAL